MRTAEEIVFHYYRSQNPMLLQNWKRIISQQDLETKKFLRCMRVTGEVANITNYDILVRVPAPGVPDGFYSIVDSAPQRLHRSCSWIAYPDVEVARVNVEALGQPPFMDNATVGEFLLFITANKEKTCHVEFREDCVHIGPDLHSPAVQFNFPFGFRKVLTVAAATLETALREALRYSHVCFATEGEFPLLGSDVMYPGPIFIGGWLNNTLSWDHCILLKPTNSNYPVNTKSYY